MSSKDFGTSLRPAVLPSSPLNPPPHGAFSPLLFFFFFNPSCRRSPGPVPRRLACAHLCVCVCVCVCVFAAWA